MLQRSIVIDALVGRPLEEPTLSHFARITKRENEDTEELLKGVLFRAISGAASHLAYYDPKERREKNVRHKIGSYQIPTEHLNFPELKEYFSAKERDRAEALFRLEFHNERKEKVGRKRKRIIRKRTELSIYFGIPKKVCAFSLKYSERNQPEKLDFFPPVPAMDERHLITLDKWRSRHPFERVDLEIADLDSFWKSLKSALEEDDPQFLPQLEEQVLRVV